MKALRIMVVWSFLITLASCTKEDFKDFLDSANPGKGAAGQVYTLNNQVSGNYVLLYKRNSDGTLTPDGSLATGGMGTGAGLGSQGALNLSANHKWLFAVNAGSNDISVMEVKDRKLKLIDKVPSGGTMPISLTQYGSWLYVLHAGGTGNITGFTLSANGHLTPIPNSTRPLSSPAAGPAQIQFSQDGNALIVTEKATNTISSYPVNGSGIAGMLNTHPAAGQTPFGFSLGHQNQFYVSEAWGGAPNKSTLSSYAIDAAGNITTLDGPKPTNQTSACWVVTTNNGKLVYTVNAASGSLSGFQVDNTGKLTLLHPSGIAGVTGEGSSPTDAALSEDSKFLYVLQSGTQAIKAFTVNSSGSLSPVDEDAGLPVGTVGLVAR
jgi:6-phosphogluconolactonase